MTLPNIKSQKKQLVWCWMSKCQREFYSYDLNWQETEKVLYTGTDWKSIKKSFVTKYIRPNGLPGLDIVKRELYNKSFQNTWYLLSTTDHLEAATVETEQWHKITLQPELSVRDSLLKRSEKYLKERESLPGMEPKTMWKIRMEIQWDPAHWSKTGGITGRKSEKKNLAAIWAES